MRSTESYILVVYVRAKIVTTRTRGVYCLLTSTAGAVLRPPDTTGETDRKPRRRSHSLRSGQRSRTGPTAEEN